MAFRQQGPSQSARNSRFFRVFTSAPHPTIQSSQSSGVPIRSSVSGQGAAFAYSVLMPASAERQLPRAVSPRAAIAAHRVFQRCYRVNENGDRFRGCSAYTGKE